MHWPLIEADLHDIYGIDVDDEVLMTAHSWRWLRARILGLMSRPPSVVTYSVGEVTKLAVVPSTRVGFALDPPTFDPAE